MRVSGVGASRKAGEMRNLLVLIGFTIVAGCVEDSDDAQLEDTRQLQLSISACPDPNNCTPPELRGCPDPNNCIPPELLACPDPKNCIPPELLACPDPKNCIPPELLACPDPKNCIPP